MPLLSRVDQITEQLREEIVSLKRMPGTPLVRAELIEQFAASSTPLREAILRLEHEDLVRVFPQHATVVTRISLSSARRIQFQRRALELEVIEQHCRNPVPGIVERLEEQIVLQQACVEAEDRVGFVQLDREFHRILYAAFDLVPLLDQLRRMSGHINRVRRLALPGPGKPTEIVDQHRTILAGIRDRDIAAARSAVRQHLQNALAAAEQLKASRPELFDE